MADLHWVGFSEYGGHWVIGGSRGISATCLALKDTLRSLDSPSHIKESSVVSNDEVT